jgi:uncharacterized membrane protein
MKTKLKVLLAGESWATHGVHVKGFASYDTSSYEEGLEPLQKALENGGCEFSYIRNHEAAQTFPSTMEGLCKYDVIIFSDIPSDTILLHNDTFVKGLRTPNRLRLIADYVSQGGGFLMVGGYMSFSGFQAKANYQFTPIADILPVKLLGMDDRLETPEGVYPKIIKKDHPILAGIPAEWPHFLGYNKLLPGEGELLMSCQGDPFLSVRQYGKGRVGAFASDCSPHWAPPEFVAWKYYQPFWIQLVEWLANK